MKRGISASLCIYSWNGIKVGYCIFPIFWHRFFEVEHQDKSKILNCNFKVSLRWHDALGLAGTELVFFTVAHWVLCFRFKTTARNMGLEVFERATDVAGYTTNTTPSSGWTTPVFLNLNIKSPNSSIITTTLQRRGLLWARPRRALWFCLQSITSASGGSNICIEAVAERPGRQKLKQREWPAATDSMWSFQFHAFSSPWWACWHTSFSFCVPRGVSAKAPKLNDYENLFLLHFPNHIRFVTTPSMLWRLPTPRVGKVPTPRGRPGPTEAAPVRWPPARPSCPLFASSLHIVTGTREVVVALRRSPCISH